MYQMSQGIAAVVNENSDSVELNAEPAAGSSQSPRLVDQGEADFGFMTRLAANDAQQGTGAFEDDPLDMELQHVFNWYRANMGMVSRSRDEAETVYDIEGMSVSPSIEGADSRTVLMEHIAHAVDHNDYQITSVGFGQQPSQLSGGQVDIVADVRLNGEIVPSYIEELFSVNDDAYILHWPEDVVSSIEGDDRLSSTYYTADDLGTDIGLGDRDGENYADVIYDAVASPDVPAEDVEEILRIMDEHYDDLSGYHSMAEYLTIDWMSDLDSNLPVHEGAESYY